MAVRVRLAVTADLHWGVRPRGDEATDLLVEHLRGDPPDLLLLAGDVGAGTDFAACLSRFADLPCRKALVPGNHDVWVREDDDRGDSLDVYREHLPRVSAAYGFHYLDAGPLLWPEAALAVVGTMNWYDYSWALDRLRELFPEDEGRLRTKRFTRGRHNDAVYVRWPFDDVGFTREAVAVLQRHLADAVVAAGRVIVVTHHPPFMGLNFPRSEPARTLDALLWEAFSGNQAMEDLLIQHAAAVPLVFCGHTHRARHGTLGPVRGYNVGGDYHFKRLLRLDWPDGPVEEYTFGDPDFLHLP